MTRATAQRETFNVPNGAGGVWRVEVLAFVGKNARVRVVASGEEMTVPVDQLSKEGKRRTR